MAYTKTTWADGDLITAAKMNKMEQGIEDGQNEDYPGYDVIVRLNSRYTSDATEATLVKGSYAEIAAKVNAQEPIFAFVYGVGTDGDNCKYFSQFEIVESKADVSYSDMMTISFKYHGDSTAHSVNIDENGVSLVQP